MKCERIAKPCPTRKLDADVEFDVGVGKIVPDNLKKPENKHKVRNAVFMIGVGIFGVIFFFTTTPAVGLPPVDPVSFSFSMFIGILFGAAIAVLFMIVYVSKKAKGRKKRA